jgi:hypothetical protein
MIRFIANEGNLQEISINLENMPIRKEKHYMKYQIKQYG